MKKSDVYFLTLQGDLLLYIHFIRESNFQVYVFSIKNLMKWIFFFDHYHYARWGTCLDIYFNFIRGNFSFQKSYRQFSKMAVDPGPLTKQRKN